MRRLIASLSVIGCLLIAPAGVARADCDTPGDFGAGSGCPPPGSDSSDSGGTESWPPTSVDWPPKFDSAFSGDNEKSKTPPIVMPEGMAAQPATNVPEAPAPIVGAGSGSSTSTSPTSTPIVMPGS
ncbi:hypothetical protein FHT40_003428 [Mycolicibacterium sp. BK556]|uniref:hypothetical protein n=1 Tax=unclassified Mycolicibacterium TaxID=2636767 RepID=UPI00161AD5A7|nr:MULTISPECIES: hypothetical protein [unclassified Mycolicibacterium]MBB3603767.1 hypothetical protein [Mycolicibacterium sp. BK556]MBB3633962.1 hypothetical protein [Mycolicibacterium sp. BK607]